MKQQKCFDNKGHSKEEFEYNINSMQTKKSLLGFYGSA